MADANATPTPDRNLRLTSAPSLDFAVVEPLELFRTVIPHVVHRDNVWLVVYMGVEEQRPAKLPDDVANLSQYGAPPDLAGPESKRLLQLPLRPGTADNIADRLLPVIARRRPGISGGGGLGDIYVAGKWGVALRPLGGIHPSRANSPVVNRAQDDTALRYSPTWSPVASSSFIRCNRACCRRRHICRSALSDGTLGIGQSVRMTAGRDTAFGLPEVPMLAEVVAAWGDAGHWAVAVDDQWRSLYLSDELASAARGQVVVGEFMFGAARVAASLAGKAGINTIEELRAQFMLVGGWMLVDLGREALRKAVDPALRDLVDGLEPCDDEARWYEIPTTHFGGSITTTTCGNACEIRPDVSSGPCR